MLTVGVDLAAEPKGTAVAWVKWGAGRAVVLRVSSGADDSTPEEEAAARSEGWIAIPRKETTLGQLRA